ncbi:hypothetical protein CIB93_05835 [Streptomyces sp. WZ.A104]|uniref:hypothetical protein n=1 Tax=Streptomyces sp. WZ.A104 TaxID=2023771 RepID=UPI000BBC1FF2|nr:hypothetical protein [Streptomyces sp. WZ.A104]PCG87055.1 hypothetical protein CIB93_05835 [Streptomyces sp. WZ.A104]
MADEELPRYATAPEDVICEVVRSADASCRALDVTKVITAVFRHRPQRRELAEALVADPGLLTSGRGQGPRSIERLIRALRECGATGVVLPGCGDCGQQRPLKALAETGRICGTCVGRRRVRVNPCVICGSINFVGRDRDGRARCRKHPPDAGVDPACELGRLLAGATGLSEEAVAEAVATVERSRGGRLKLLWSLQDAPDQLGGGDPVGPPKISALARVLVDLGAVGVVVPLCPFCRTSTQLRSRRDGLRCCTACWSQVRIEWCARCRRERPIGGRAFDGQPVCGSCRQADAFNRRPCSGCGELRVRKNRTAEGGLCYACTEVPAATCATCRQHRPCRYANTASPRCLPCCAKAREQAVCVGCGQLRRVNNRTATGEPLCASCGVKPKPCTGCGKTFKPAGRTSDGRPLCQTCWGKDPGARRPCTSCGAVERLYHRGLCPGCTRERSVNEVLTGPDGRVRPELDGVRAALFLPPPRTVLRWINKTPARHAAFRALAEADGPVTHAVLDRVADDAVAAHLRALLVAGGALPERDEHLARLEAWLTRTIARVPDPEERRILWRYVRWQPLRRLRRLPPGRHVTHGQADAVRMEIRNVVRLLEWLHPSGTGLADCTQDELDAWLADGAPQRTLVRGFVRWTSRHHHSKPLTAPLYTSNLAAQVIAQDQRWRLVRRLISDTELQTTDRAAGLLLLLFAQPAARICRLTADHVLDDGHTLRLRLGRQPVDIPAPLDDLIRELARRRRIRAPVGPEHGERWLFPGMYAGRPLEPHSLGRRLKNLGIRPRVARNSSLMDIASELPAYVFSRLLGFSQSTADNWDTEAGGFGPAYGAELSRRTTTDKFTLP